MRKTILTIAICVVAMGHSSVSDEILDLREKLTDELMEMIFDN